MGSATITSELVSTIAAEMASGVEIAVECWMAEVEHALEDTYLTTLGRLNAVRGILDNYKRLTGKTQLECRRALAIERQEDQVWTRSMRT